MDFYEIQEEIKLVIKNSLHVNTQKCKKAKALCEYIDIENLNTTYEDENKVNNKIIKYMEVLSKNICENLYSYENADFGYILPDLINANNGYFYIWGVTSKEDEELKIPQFNKVPKHVLYKDRFIVLLDFEKNIQFIPWINANLS